jgi:cobalamin biosynthesis Mg chelatase CobN
LNIQIDSRLLEALQQSTCFGIAYDETVPECKQCDVRAQCKKKSEGFLNIPTPTAKPKKTAQSSTKEDKPASKATTTASKPKATKTVASKSTAKATAKSTSTVKKAGTKKSTPVPAGNMPEFKSMTLDELKELAAERNVKWKDYGNDNITRMRLIMELKKSYQQ